MDSLLSQQDRRRSNLTGLCGGGLQTREVYCVQANAELLKYLNDLKEKDKGKNKSNPLFCNINALKMLLLTVGIYSHVESKHDAANHNLSHILYSLEGQKWDSCLLEYKPNT